MRIVLLLVVVGLVLYLTARQFNWLSSDSANPIGQGSATLTKSNSGGTCGIVADVRFDSSNQGPAMFVDLGRPHPIESMQIVIPQRNLGRFDPSPASWEGQRICVTGPVKSYGGRPEIIAHGPNQIHVDSN
ncbi:MAG: hypothetical protein ACRES7_11880 [Gammaproteobacteria bacterium]